MPLCSDLASSIFSPALWQVCVCVWSGQRKCFTLRRHLIAPSLGDRRGGTVPLKPVENQRAVRAENANEDVIRVLAIDLRFHQETPSPTKRLCTWVPPVVFSSCNITIAIITVIPGVRSVGKKIDHNGQVPRHMDRLGNGARSENAARVAAKCRLVTDHCLADRQLTSTRRALPRKCNWMKRVREHARCESRASLTLAFPRPGCKSATGTKQVPQS
ncbi:hypothetical protein ZHAS_00000984 [Anopheles sinensis]|uniref:Uncharacterized protein n=1 Tax=Anopheles sinensis TaxID=74873 RepID=A0A084VAV8_ANOSI|nr:hypothetical protein ZHAS_00000984 [Anopheles sinensis]